MNEKQKKQITLLIKEFSRNQNTSSLLSFVAESHGMLGVCREMVEKFDAGNPDIDRWLTSKCRDIGIAEHAILKEIRDIVGLFTPGRTMEEPFTLLGVSADASREEIKRAYRQLSLTHHPDTADQSTDYNPDTFIQITRAYHALLSPDKNSDQRISRRPKPVRKQERRRSVSVKQRKKVFLWITGIFIVLLLVTMLFAINYRKRTMIAGLQHSMGAFIPPKAERTVSLSAPYLSEGRADTRYQFQNRGNTNSVGNSDSQVGNSQASRDGDESHQKGNNVRSVKENTLVPIKGALGVPVTMSDMAGTEPHSSKQDDSSSTGTSRAQSNDADIRIDENIVNLKQNKILKRIVEPDSQESNQPVAEILQPEVTANAEKEFDNAPYRDRGMGQDEMPGSNSQIQTQQAAEKHKNIPLQDGEADEAIDQQSASVSNQGNTEDTTSNLPRDENAILGREEFISKTIAVQEMNNLAVSSQDKLTPLSQELDNRVSPQIPQQRVDQFLLGYIDAYTQRNIRVFTNYFIEDALENGKPFQEMQSIYDELFEATKAVTLQINDRELHQESENIVVEGTFEVFLLYKDNRKISGSGPIIFILVDQGNGLKIKNLSYEFN